MTTFSAIYKHTKPTKEINKINTVPILRALCTDIVLATLIWNIIYKHIIYHDTQMAPHCNTKAMPYEDQIRDDLVAISHPEQNYSIKQ